MDVDELFKRWFEPMDLNGDMIARDGYPDHLPEAPKDERPAEIRRAMRHPGLDSQQWWLR